ncbi:DedA family protein [Peribacillus cavernae]|uniref:DedA family protein n=1 Tax=Peribacillus cavernae TaxID=1674310 RepID=A0A3S0VN90_9BACI|nr:DedA family protein [Peribacillus cavernae]MDQ0218379.1 membrane protein DedA with SNARE-associated domain [Peribacillus cavernae]RUQ31388.1 DedA family protein [Peribacillus cavernae]
MSLENVTPYIQQYGYWLVFFILFCGIVGIPAPEETFLLFIGILCAKHQLSYSISTGAAIIGVLVGMLTAYWIGKKVGLPFVHKYGRYVKITPERWDRVDKKFRKHGTKSLIVGFYLPGLRQLNPYIAGACRYPFYYYLFLSIIGSGLWVTIFITLGYFLGDQIDIAYIGLIAALLLVFVFVKWVKDKKAV